MKSIRTIAALIAVIGMGSYAQAGHDVGCGASKCCDCAPTFQPTCCKPKIVRPCHRNIYNYQRQFVKSCCVDPGCGNGCGSPALSCCPTGAGNGCGNGCTDPNNCGAGNGCGAGCTDPNNCGAGNGCGAGATTCAAPAGAGNGCTDPNNCGAGAGNGCTDPNNCGAGAGNGCTDPNSCAAGAGAGDCCTTAAVCCKDACEIAELIYQSQTGCKAHQRRRALSKLGRKYDCVCNPEIMSAFIYGLNDADHRVRRTAADKIGDELRKNKCCCSQCVVEALTIALADCDRGVRRQAEQALKQCGYDVVNPTCQKSVCDTTCVDPGKCCDAGKGCDDPSKCCDAGNGCGAGAGAPNCAAPCGAGNGAGCTDPNNCAAGNGCGAGTPNCAAPCGAGNGCGNSCVSTGCATAPAYSPAAAPAAAPAQAPAAAPAVAPAPPAEPKAYFPRKISDENARPVSSTKSLKNVYGLVR